MVYGQELDLKYEALAATEEQLRLIHRNKTGALINAAIQMGAAAAQADEAQCKALEAYAYGIGLVFQIVDDVLDVTSTAGTAGQAHWQRQRKWKNDFCDPVMAWKVPCSLHRLNDETCTALRETFGEKAAFLEQLAQQLLCAKTKTIIASRKKEKDYAVYSRHPVFQRDPYGFAPGWFVAQVLKTIINFILLGKFQLERMWGDGGMPSAHSATVCAMVIATARCEGIDSAIFAVAAWWPSSPCTMPWACAMRLASRPRC